MQKRPDLVILGAGGFARELAGWLDFQNYCLLGFYSDSPEVEKIFGYPVFARLSSLHPSTKFAVAIGDPLLRQRMAAYAEDLGFKAVSKIADGSVRFGFWPNEIGEGSMLCPNVVITTGVKIGAHCLLNLGATIGHDTTLGNFVTVSPGANISGNVWIGDGAYIGTNSSIREGVKIGEGAVVGMGAAVVKDVLPFATVKGVPAL